MTALVLLNLPLSDFDRGPQQGPALDRTTGRLAFRNWNTTSANGRVWNYQLWGLK